METHNLSGKTAKKRLARILAVQSIYSHFAMKEERDIKYSIHDVVTTYKTTEFSEKVSKADERLAIEVANHMKRNFEMIDSLIAEFIDKNWKISRLPLLVLSILRAAIAEFSLYNTDSAVIINEYVEITKLFNHEAEAGFVNKVLDSALKKLHLSF